MNKYLLRRIYQTVLVLLIVVTIVFVLFRLLPGDPTDMMVDQSFDEVTRKRLLAEWGLDAPLHEQYFVFIKNLLWFNFGESFYYRVPAGKAIYLCLWNSIVLMGTAMAMSLSAGFVLGIYLGWRRGSRRERFMLVFAMFLRATPIFWSGIILLMILTYWAALFPTGGMRSLGYSAKNLFWTYFSFDFLYHWFLPFLTATLHFMVDPLMVTRTSMLEVKGEDFLEFGQSLGFSEMALMRHCGRNALLPVVTYTAIMMGFVFGGQVLLEVIFAWPGMGREMVLAIERRDYPVAQASFLIMATVVILMNFVIDLLYGYLDPRIKYG